MDSIVTFGTLATMLKAYGAFGLLVVIWYFDMRAIRQNNERHHEENSKVSQSHKEETSKILSQHEKYMDEIRRMYESNVKLVNSYERLANDLHEVVIMNTQAMTGLKDDINRNQYCPHVRVTKEKIGVVKL